MKERLAGLVRVSLRRPALAVGLVAAAALAGGVLALGLQPSAATDTFVSSSSSSYQATTDDYRHFGGDAVIILIREPLSDLVETKDLATVSQLEACLGGQVLTANSQLQAFTPSAPGAAPYGGYRSPCGQLMRTRPVAVVYGPGTFLNRAVAAVNQQVNSMLSNARRNVQIAQSAAYQLALAHHLSRQQALRDASAAQSLAQQQATNQLAQMYLDSGISGMPRIDDPQFIPQIVFDQTRGVNQPKARFAYLFPTANSALIQVRLRAGLSQSQQAQAISLIRRAVAMPMFRSGYGGTYTVTGEPVVVNDLTSEIGGSISILLVVAVIVMGITLLIAFRPPRGPRRHPAETEPVGGRSSGLLRLLPLALALAATGITFGLMALLGVTLTMASIAVLPIMIGLAVDYAIQFQSRTEEARRTGPTGETRTALLRAASLGAPTIAVAALATATGFLVLLLSPVPMVQGFGLLLVLGIAVAFGCTLTAGSAAIMLADRLGGRGGGCVAGRAGASLRGAGELMRESRRALTAAGRSAVELVRSAVPVGRRQGGGLVPEPQPRLLGRLRPARARTRGPRLASPPWRRISALPGAVARRPGRVIAVGLALAVIGWVADTQTAVQSDVTKLVPSNMPALRDLNTLEKVTGVSGEIDVVVRAGNVATPKTVGWMTSYERTLLAHFGYVEAKGCAKATLCPALSLPDLFSGGSSTTGQGAAPPLSQSSITGLLNAVPGYFSQAVITPDRREAALAFGIRLMPLSRQQQVISYMQSQLHPPAGVSARLAGLSVLAAQANGALASSGRRLLTLVAGLLAVGLMLLAIFRRAERAFVPLIPIALATGWSALILFLTRIPLNPMSASMGALVIAISTEFSVLLSERYRQERQAGIDRDEALGRAYRSTGAAVVASGITAIAGFGVLVVSNITMLRDFGLVTLIDLSVSQAGVLLVLPSAIALVESGQLGEQLTALRRTAPRLRVRRRATVAP